MFSEKLKDLRKKNGLTQEQLAEKLNYTRTAISAYELGRNRPKYEDLKKLADFFDVSIAYLVDDEQSIIALQAKLDDFSEPANSLQQEIRKLLNMEEKPAIENFKNTFHKFLMLNTEYNKVVENILQLYSFSQHELAVIEAYRNMPEVRSAVDKLLDIEPQNDDNSQDA